MSMFENYTRYTPLAPSHTLSTLLRSAQLPSPQGCEARARRGRRRRVPTVHRRRADGVLVEDGGLELRERGRVALNRYFSKFDSK